MKSYLNPVILLTLLATLLLSTRLTDATVQSPTNDEGVASQPTPPLDEAQVTTALQSSSVMFIENVGQFDDDARFHVRGGQFSMWLADEALWITLLEAPDEENQPTNPLTHEPIEHGFVEKGTNLPAVANDEPRRGVNLKLSFVDANPQPTIEPFNRLESKVNYFKGNDPDKWRPDVPVWGGVRYKNLYPGIDLELTSENGQTVQRLVAHPDADLSIVSLRVEGAESMELLPEERLPSPRGRGAGGEGRRLPSPILVRGAGDRRKEGGEGHSLHITTTIGSLTLPLLPVVTPDGTPLDITSPPTLNDSDILAPFAPYSPNTQQHLPLVTGPSLAYSTFVGGTNDDVGQALALDKMGAVVTGSTGSSDFPTTAGGYDTTHNRSGDVFVLKLASDGGTLLYSTFVGGTSYDSVRSLALDSAGNAVITGSTNSSDFPAGGYDTTHNGSNDLFVAKIASDGGALLYSTFVGGTDNDYSRSLALDSAGNAVITGYTQSSDFPTTAGGYDTTYNGGLRDVFVAKIASDGGSLLYSTFVGGTNDDYGRSLALDSAANAVITGYTESSDFPTTAGGYDTTHNGNRDVFVAKIASDGGSLLYSTFVGGTSLDYGWSLALDSAANAVITGETESSDFPATAGGYDTTHNGDLDVFVAKIASDGGSLLYSTFVGGTDLDGGYSLALDSAGNAVITGYTYSSHFPTTAGGYDTTHNGDLDVFVLRLDGLGSVPTPTPTNTPVPPTPTNTPTPTPTSPLALDAYEVDDECEQASPIATTGVVQNHTFHTPGDVDWAEFAVISGTTYLIEAQTPSESTADVVLEVYSTCGTLPTFSQDYTFTPDIRLSFTAIEDGPLYLQLSNYDPDVGGADKSYRLSIRALGDSASPGALVLVAGRIRANDPLQSQIHNVTNEVYRTFLRHGYDGERIFYLAHDLNIDVDGDGTPDVDARATNDNLEQAITDWAVPKVGPARPFTLYLMDHGGEDVFFLNGRTDTVAPEEVDQWLEALEEAAGNVKVNIFMEACHSGSFLESVSGDGRVVMASTGTYAVAYASPGGAVFSDAFLSGLERGMSLYGAFSEAQWIVQEAHPDQTPWMDDDGNGIPNEGADGLEAQRRGFAYAGTLPDNQKWPPYIAWAEVADIQGETALIRADVRDDVSVLTVSAVVYKPSYTPPNPEETEEIVQEELPTVTLFDLDGDGIYSALYESFNEQGSYRLVIYALDGEGIAGRPLAIEIQVGGYQLYLPSVMR